MIVYRLFQAIAILVTGCLGLVLAAGVAGHLMDGEPGMPGLVGLASLLVAAILTLRQAAAMRRDGKPGAATALLALVMLPGLLGIAAFVGIGLLFTLGAP